MRDALVTGSAVAISDRGRGESDDPDGPFEGRLDMVEVSEAEFLAYRRRNPDGHWNIKTPVGVPGPERFFVIQWCADAPQRGGY